MHRIDGAPTSAPTTDAEVTVRQTGAEGPATGPQWNGRWPLERVLFALAGTMTLVSAVLAAAVSPWFLLLTGFIAASEWAFALVGKCPASLVLGRAFGLQAGCAR